MPTTEDHQAFRCSDAARERQDPMLGTAPPQHRFLLVEQESGWAFDGFASAPLPVEVRTEAQQRAAAVGGRIMLIRRPGRHPVGYRRAWCVVDTAAPTGHRVTWGTWSAPSELLHAVERLEELDRWDRQRAAPPDATPGDDETLVLVCTHGKKDVCCAVRGRPVALDLASRWPGSTWECSHTGGDRFAANVVVLPDGATYGGLGVEEACEVLAEHHAGRPRTAYLRGVVGHPRPVQAAIVAVHDQLGPLPCGSVEAVGSEPLEAPDGVAAASLVRLRLPDGRDAEVEVREHDRPPARLTCQAVAPKVSRVPVPGVVRVLDPR
ncbi:hypothetical protein FB476_1038 [Ornithinimicrobium humiphilum]|uniref:Sucrase/ferredoxin-like protein n=1 Tax=Ornithinimicrobium humiphilum TaxID=125288 RepID=A0A543KMB3_9MICO|nr:sucrase ferredoxin [Ornithinimicrobium humiphilum]TQM96174.1 hypothetical protein FB476_1038 [Ornithinimicrobium humiphilum]